MKEFKLEYCNIILSDEAVLTIEIITDFKKRTRLLCDAWKKLSKDIDDLPELMRQAEIFYEKQKNLITEDIIDECISHDVFDLSAELLMKRGWFVDSDNIIYGILVEINESYGQILRQEENEKNYREMRKANRGRWEGGGFGIGGALKGAAMAGVLNGATGIAHSAVNLIGNTISHSKAEKAKEEMSKDSKVRDKITDGIGDAIFSLWKVKLGVFVEYLKVKCDLFSQNEVDIATALLGNAKKITDSRKRAEITCKAIEKNPFDREAYIYYLDQFGDATGELEKIADFTDTINLRLKKSNMLYELYNKTNPQKCGDKDSIEVILAERKKLYSQLTKIDHLKKRLHYNDNNIYKMLIEERLLQVGGYQFENIDAANRFADILECNRRRIIGNRIFFSEQEKENYFKDLKKYQAIIKKYNYRENDIESMKKCLMELKDSKISDENILEEVKKLESDYQEKKEYYDSYAYAFYCSFIELYNISGSIDFISCNDSGFSGVLDKTALVNTFQKQKENFLLISKKDMFEKEAILSDVYWRSCRGDNKKYIATSDITHVESIGSYLYIYTDRNKLNTEIYVNNYLFIKCLNMVIEKARENYFYNTPEKKLGRGKNLIAKKKLDEGIQWCIKAANEGYGRAQYYLGCFYLNNKSKKNLYLSKKYFLMAKNNEEILFSYIGLATVAMKFDYNEAATWYNMYLAKEEEINIKNPKVYVAVAKKIAKWFYSGSVIKKNIASGVDCYEKAANFEDAEAEFEVGVAYYCGMGKEKNNENAFWWLNKAYEHGEKRAAMLLGDCYYNGYGCTIDYENAFDCYLTLSDKNYQAQYKLGICYELGRGCEQNYQFACYYYEKAAKAGLRSARVRLNEIKEKGGYKDDSNK